MPFERRQHAGQVIGNLVNDGHGRKKDHPGGNTLNIPPDVVHKKTTTHKSIFDGFPPGKSKASAIPRKSDGPPSNSDSSTTRTNLPGGGGEPQRTTRTTRHPQSTSPTTPAGNPSGDSTRHSASSTATTTHYPPAVATPVTAPATPTSKPSTSGAPAKAANSGGGVSGGVIAAAVIVPLVVIALAILAIFWYRRHKRQKGYNEKSGGPHSPASDAPVYHPSERGFGSNQPDQAPVMAAPVTNLNKSSDPPRYYTIPRKQPATRVSPFDDANRSRNSSGFITPLPDIPGQQDGHFMDISPEEAAATTDREEQGVISPRSPAAPIPLGTSLTREKDDDEISAVSDENDNVVYGNAEVTSIGQHQRASMVDMDKIAGSSRESQTSQDDAEKSKSPDGLDLSHEPPKW